MRAGTVTSADGRAAVDVPAGALPQNIIITVSSATNPAPNTLMVGSTAYDLGPNGTQFSKPLTLTITYDPAKLPAGGDAQSLALYHLVNDTWQQVAGSTVDTVAHTVRGSISSFSIYSIQVTALIAHSLAAGDDFTCALNRVGAAFCWGNGTLGQLGDGTMTSSSTPVAVAGGHKFRALSADAETACGLLEDGSAECWGKPPGGLSRPSGTNAQPATVLGSVRFSTLSVGLDFACGIATTGGAYCWGSDFNDELGLGNPDAAFDTALHAAPTAVSGGSQFVAISAGGTDACALDASGAAYCWGDSLFGELGIGQFDSLQVSHPVAVGGDLVFRSLSAGSEYVCGIVVSGATDCWGSNLAGNVGDGTTSNRNVPTAVSGNPSFAAVFAGAHNDVTESTCALAASGAASCWGNNDSGQLGASSSNTCTFVQAFPCSFEPLAVQGGLTFGTLALGDVHACGMTSGRKVYCWGANNVGQLGDGTTTSSPTPVLSSFSPVAFFAARFGRTPVGGDRTAIQLPLTHLQT